MKTRDYDVIIVGGGPAGLSAALLLGRACRRVLVCDTGKPRNAASHALHAFITRDGIHPARFRQVARAQLKRYSTVEFLPREVVDAHPAGKGFQVTLRNRSTANCRALLLATGRIDIVPHVKAADRLLGHGVYPCPYCDAWEKRDRSLAVCGNDFHAVELALQLRDWSNSVVLCTNGRARLSARAQQRLRRHGVKVRSEKINRLESRDGELARIRFQSGNTLRTEALFFYPRQYQQSPLAAKLGCRFNRDGSVACDGHSRTNVPGVYVAGNIRCGLQLAIVAAAEGAEAGYVIHSAFLEADYR